MGFIFSVGPDPYRHSRPMDDPVLLDNGEVMMIWIGNSVSPQVLLGLFGVDDINGVNSRTV